VKREQHRPEASSDRIASRCVRATRSAPRRPSIDCFRPGYQRPETTATWRRRLCAWSGVVRRVPDRQGKARPALSQNNGDDGCWKNGVELHCGRSRSFAAPRSESSYRCAFASVYRHGMSPVTPRPLTAAFISIHQSPTYIL